MLVGASGPQQEHETTNVGARRSKVKVTRSHEAKDRFRGLAEASFSTPVG